MSSKPNIPDKATGDNLTAIELNEIVNYFSLKVENADELTSGTLPIARIGDGEITEAKLAVGVQTKLNERTTDASDLTSGTLPVARIGDGSIVEGKLDALSQVKLNIIPKVYYVRPSGGSYGLENGINYDNAWNGFENINWTLITKGTILYVCGTHNETLTLEANYFNIRGDYYLEAGIIDVNNLLNYCIYVGSEKNITINGIEIANSITSNIDIRGTSIVYTYDLVTHGCGNQNIQHLDTAKGYHYRLETYDGVDDGVSLHDDTYCEIHDSYIHDNTQGVNNIATSTLKVYNSIFENNSEFDAYVTAGTSAIAKASMELHNCYLPGTISSRAFSDFYAQNCYIGEFATDTTSTINMLLERCFVNNIELDAQANVSFSAKYCILKSDGTPSFGIIFRAGSIPLLDNCTIVGNGLNKGIFIGVNCTLNNNIVSGFTTGIQAVGAVTGVINNTCFFDNGTDTLGTGGGVITNNNPINSDPLFVDDLTDDYELELSSPCISSGILTNNDLGIKTANWGSGTTPIIREKSNGKPFDVGAFVK
jgi:hypothetical protein